MVKLYRHALATHGDSPAAVLWPKGRQDLRFGALTGHIAADGFSVLDYGCGLGHLKDFLDRRFSTYSYRGVDIVPEFLDALRKRHAGAQVRPIRSHADVTETVDHVVISGTFNIVVGDSAEAYLGVVYSALAHLFRLCRVSLAVNFMTDRVDYRQEHTHHVNVEQMYRHVRDQLSPRLTLDQSELPYEFTIVAYKNSTIVRPDNIYEPL